MKIFTGTGVALVTPFDEHLHIDKEALRTLVHHVITGGVDFLVVLGTTGESATLTSDEKAEVVYTVVEANHGRLPIMVGIGGNNTLEVIREIRQSAWLNECQGILSITPCYTKPSQEGLYRHFKAIAEASPLPLCLYNVPGRTGINICATTITRLAQDCLNIVALKEASGSFEQATAILKTRQSGFSVLSGDDSILLPLMAMGFEGVISVMANVLPRECSTLVNSMRNGDYATARTIHFCLSDMCKALFEEGNPAGVKAALHAAGIISHNTLRLPLTPVTDHLYMNISAMTGSI